MTPPVPQSSATLGPLVGDYRASRPILFVYAIFGVLALWLAVVQIDDFQRIIALVCAVGFGIGLYRRIGAHVQIFEHGFVISRAFKTTSARWDEVAGVEYNFRRNYSYTDLIPTPTPGTHTYTITLTNGTQIKLNNWYFSNIIQVGNMIQKLWRQTVPANTRLP